MILKGSKKYWRMVVSRGEREEFDYQRQLGHNAFPTAPMIMLLPGTLCADDDLRKRRKRTTLSNAIVVTADSDRIWPTAIAQEDVFLPERSSTRSHMTDLLSVEPTKTLRDDEINISTNVKSIQLVGDGKKSSSISFSGHHYSLLHSNTGRIDPDIIDAFAEVLNLRCIRGTGKEETKFVPSFVFCQLFLDAIFKNWRQTIDERDTNYKKRVGQLPFKDGNARPWYLERKGISLQELRYIFFPMLIAAGHWGLVIIDLENRRIQYYNSLMQQRNARFIIGHIATWMNHLNYYEKRYSMDEDFKKWPRTLVSSAYPRQEDGDSCGIFVLFVAEYLQRGAAYHSSIYYIDWYHLHGSLFRLATCFQTTSSHSQALSTEALLNLLMKLCFSICRTHVMVVRHTSHRLMS